MRLFWSLLHISLSGALGIACGTAGFAQASPVKAAGEAVYRQRCSGCHDQTNPRIPPRSSLSQMPAERILHVLDFGVMMTVAYPMSRDERQAVAAYIGTGAPAVSFPPEAYCKDRKVTVSDKPKGAWNGWSADPGNTRYQSAAAAGLSIDQVRNLKVKWALASTATSRRFPSPP